MNTKVITKELDLNGRKLKLEVGKLARQADAAVVASLGETVVLATVATKPLASDIGYFPLSVEYVEKHYAGGRITPQRFIKREARPSEKAVLSGRAIDRSIRPLFPKDFQNEVQVIITVLSIDSVNDPVLVGFIGASAALSISSVPWAGPLGVARVCEKSGEFVINPDLESIDERSMNLVVASTDQKVTMIETEAKQVDEKIVFDGIKKAFEASQPIVSLINELTKEVGKEKIAYKGMTEGVDEAVLTEVKKEIKEKISAALLEAGQVWHDSLGSTIKSEITEKYSESLTSTQISSLFEKIAKEFMNDIVLNKGKRVDGRKMEEVRALHIETSVLPRTHGSALFERGESQVLSIATLGPLSVAQLLEGMEGESTKRFMHHYNMSINPFSSGEVKRLGAPNRRDIGHGELAEKAVRNVLPSEEEFPYAIRVVSEILGANASTSQAAICGTILALLNAGVKVEPVAGIALGLLSNEGGPSSPNEEKFQVITDMQAVEDFFGEMDFKVAGTRKGVTAIQMDTKLHGLSFEIIEEALRQGKIAREFILDEMAKAAPSVEELSQYAPKIEVTHIKPEEIGLLIGSGGKTINGIIAKTGAQVDIEDDGTVMVSSMDQEAINAALDLITGMFKKVQPGEEYDGKVIKLMPFGAFVEILPGKEGLVHVSQMAPQRVEDPSEIVSEGQEVKVRVLDVDQQGKISLSMLFGADIKPDRPREERGGGGRGGFGGRSSGGGRREFGGRNRR